MYHTAPCVLHHPQAYARAAVQTIGAKDAMLSTAQCWHALWCSYQAAWQARHAPQALLALEMGGLACLRSGPLVTLLRESSPVEAALSGGAHGGVAAALACVAQVLGRRCLAAFAQLTMAGSWCEGRAGRLRDPYPELNSKP